MKRLVYGVGVNDSTHQTQMAGKGYICPVFVKWRNMLQRCYSSLGYKDCTVCEEWKIFSVFQLWVDSLEIGKSKLSGLHLDKDLLGKGNKHYSPETCCFLPPRLNTFMTNSLKGMKGTSYHKNRGKFVTQISNPITKKTEYLGYSETKEEGHVVWLKRKYELLEELLVLEDDIPDLLKSKIREVFKGLTLDSSNPSL